MTCLHSFCSLRNDSPQLENLFAKQSSKLVCFSQQSCVNSPAQLRCAFWVLPSVVNNAGLRSKIAASHNEVVQGCNSKAIATKRLARPKVGTAAQPASEASWQRSLIATPAQHSYLLRKGCNQRLLPAPVAIAKLLQPCTTNCYAGAKRSSLLCWAQLPTSCFAGWQRSFCFAPQPPAQQSCAGLRCEAKRSLPACFAGIATYFVEVAIKNCYLHQSQQQSYCNLAQRTATPRTSVAVRCARLQQLCYCDWCEAQQFVVLGSCNQRLLPTGKSKLKAIIHSVMMKTLSCFEQTKEK